MPGQVTVLYAVAVEHDCQIEIVRALAPILNNLGAGSLVECNCGRRFIRAGGPTTGFFWEEKEAQ